MIAQNPRRSRLLRTLLVGVLFVGGPLAAEAQFAFQMRYLSGDAVPGASDGAVFDTFVPPTLSESGDLMFAATVRGGDGVVEEAILAPTAGPGTPLGVAARVGDSAPGVNDGAVLENLSEPAFNSDGQVAFYAVLQPDANAPFDPSFSGRDTALFGPVSGPGSSLGLLAREGSAAPDVTDDAAFDNLYTSVGGPGMDEQGGVYFRAPLKTGDAPGAPFVTPANKFAYFGPRQDFAGPYGVLLREGDLAPGTIDGSVVQTLLSNPPLQNGLGLSVARVLLNNGAGASQAVYRVADSASAPSMLVRYGDQVFGAGDGVRYGTTFEPAVNVAGDVAFHVDLFGDGAAAGAVGSTNDAALVGPVSGSGSPLGLVFREGQLAPGATDGAVFSSFASEWLSSNGDLAFTASVRRGDQLSTSERAIFGPVAGPGSPLRMIAREGDLVPGVTDGAVFNGFTAPVLNAEGVVVFNASLVAGSRPGDGPVGPDNNSALLSYVDGQLTLLARAGDSFLVETTGGQLTEPRTISRIGTTIVDRPDADRVGLTDGGLLGLQLSFTDGSQGLFTVDLTPVPEPGAATLVPGLALGVAAGRHRTRTVGNRG